MTVRRAERGFTLIELMVAMVVFLIGMAGVFALQSYGIKGTAIASDTALATNLAASTIEELTLRDYATLPATETKYYNRYGVENLAGADYFTVTWSATDYGLSDFKDVAVSVDWKFTAGEGLVRNTRTAADGMTTVSYGVTAGAAYTHHLRLTGRVANAGP